MGGPDGWVREVLQRVVLFYTDDGMVASTDPE